MDTTNPIRIASLYDDLAASMQRLRTAHPELDRSREIVRQAMQDGRAHYGINTGFGILANKRIEPEQLAELQQNILLSHACGVGEPVPVAITRLMLQLKIHALGLGQSGISRSTFEQLLALERSGLTPWVPSRGSVGASGDLAPLAHLCLPLIGRGEVWDEQQQSRTEALPALRQAGMEPVSLQAKDGLALLNGTQLMAAYGAFVLERCIKLLKEADILAAMSLEALQGSAVPFDERIHAIRPHRGQQLTAANIRQLLIDSEILDSHRDCGKVQDPYCLRCVPQVHGASRDALSYASNVVEIELNSVTDNPLVFSNGDILSGGNFHGQPLALALDFAAIALAELASISERRTYLLLEGHDGLPKLLMNDTGVRLYDPAVHGSGAGVRKQGSVPPCLGGFHSHQPGAGRPCLDGLHQRDQAAQRDEQCGTCISRRTADGGTGTGFQATTETRRRSACSPQLLALANTSCRPRLRGA